MKVSIAVMRSATLVKLPRRISCRVMLPTKSSTIQPGAAGGGEVRDDARMAGQPGLHVRVLVSGVVVADDVQLPTG